MLQESEAVQSDSMSTSQVNAQAVHVLMRWVLAVRYRKNVVLLVMLASAILGGFYYYTATRYYSARAQIQISQSADPTDGTSMTGDESVRRNTMPTFENIVKSAKVIQCALENLAPEDRIDLIDVPEQYWVDAIQRRLSAKTVRGTSILEANFQSKDPRVAVNVVNALVHSFLQFMDKMHKGTAGEDLTLLMQEQKATAEKLQMTQQQLMEARGNCDLLVSGLGEKSTSVWELRVRYFNDALGAAQKERMELQAAVDSLRAALQNGQGFELQIRALLDIVGSDVVGRLLGIDQADANLQASLQQTLLTDRAELAMKQQHLGPAHPEIRTLVERIRMTENSIRAYQDGFRQRAAAMGHSDVGVWLAQIVEQRLAQVRQREALVQEQFQEACQQARNASNQMLQMDSLEREADSLVKWNDKLTERIAALSVRQKGQEVRSAVIESPIANTNPVSPRRLHVALAVLVGGFTVSLLLVHLLDALDDRFRTIEELQLRTGVPALTVIQYLEPRPGVGIETLSMYTNSTSSENEAFRTLRTALALSHPDARQLVVTSAEPGDGKTTILTNLAIGYARAEKKTLLIDADLRRPGLTNLLNLRGPNGLSELLRSEADIVELAARHIQASGVQGLDVLPSGPRPSNPAELLSGDRFSRLLSWAESVYDQILIDSPPTLAASDTAVIGRLVDGVIMVVQPAKNRRRLILRVTDSLSMLKIPLLGVVVNRAGQDRDAAYYGYYGGYGYGYNYGSSDSYDYHPNYGADEDSPDQETTSPAPTVPFSSHEEDPDENISTTRPVVPRRVA